MNRISQILCEQHDKSSPISSTRYAKLYPQNGECIVTSFHPSMSTNRLNPENNRGIRNVGCPTTLELAAGATVGLSPSFGVCTATSRYSVADYSQHPYDVIERSTRDCCGTTHDEFPPKLSHYYTSRIHYVTFCVAWYETEKAISMISSSHRQTRQDSLVASGLAVCIGHKTRS